MAKKKNKVIDPLLRNLPRYIHKQQGNMYMNIKTGERIHASDLHKHLPIQPDPTITDKRWDLNY